VNIILAPDSFKGTLSAREVCEIVAPQLRSMIPNSNITQVPLADGGEGMAAAWQAACGGAMQSAEVNGPFGRPVRAQWLLLKNGTAVLETASCAGLELARPQGLHPGRASTFGLGQLMRATGRRRIILGLGGSATNDAGCGMAYALGWRFFNATGELFCPTGSTLADVAAISPPEVPIPKMNITAACDVKNPLYGPNGAAHVYAPQKGADAFMVQRLDAGLRHLAKICKQMNPNAMAQTPGAGAAGGLGFGVMAFLGGTLRPGIALLLEQIHFRTLLRNADFVITGEGRMDAQTLQGKAPMGVLQCAKAAGVPVVGLCGCATDMEQLHAAGFRKIFSCCEAGQSLHALRQTCRADLAAAAAHLAQYFKLSR
jgi:glycerate kinase